MPTPPRPRLSRRRRRAFAGVACALGLVAAVALAEAWLRWFNPIPRPDMQVLPVGYLERDPETGYRHRPNFPMRRMRFFDGVNTTLLYTNSLGLHDVEPPPPDERPRVLALGCSLTEGIGRDTVEAPWPRQFERLLQRRAGTARPPVVVLNAGVMGYNVFQMTARARQVQPAVHADVWLLAFYQGRWGMWLRNATGPGGPFVLTYDNLWHRPALRQMLDQHGNWLAVLSRPSRLARNFMFVSTDWSQPRPPMNATELPWGEDNAGAARAALTAFRDAATSAGARPVVVMISAPADLERWRTGPRDADSQPQWNECHSLGLAVFDTVPVMLERFAAKPNPDQRSLVDWWANSAADPYHFNTSGLTVLAEIIADLLPREALQALPRK